MILSGQENERHYTVKNFIGMINQNFEYFPSIFEIQQGIEKAFEQNLKNKFLNKQNLS